MKLVHFLLRRSLQEYDEGVFNKEFPFFAYAQIVSICSVVLQEPIPDQRYIMELYATYNRARRDGDRQRIMQTINLLKKSRLKTDPLITRALDKFKNIPLTEANRPEVWRKDCVALLSHEFDAS